MDRVQSYTVLLLSAPSKKLLEPHTPSSLSLHKPRAFSSVSWFNSSVFLCFDLCSSHWCCEPNQSSPAPALFCCPVNSPQVCSARPRPAHAAAPELSSGCFLPACLWVLFLGAAWGGLSSSPPLPGCLGARKLCPAQSADAKCCEFDS